MLNLNVEKMCRQHHVNKLINRLVNFFYVIYQTRKAVFDHIFKHREKNWKYDAQRSIFDEHRVVWKCGQKLSWVFDISSQWKLNLRRKRIEKMKKNLWKLRLDIQSPSRSWLPLFKLYELLISLRIINIYHLHFSRHCLSHAPS